MGAELSGQTTVPAGLSNVVAIAGGDGFTKRWKIMAPLLAGETTLMGKRTCRVE